MKSISRIIGFEWDSGNRDKNLTHNVRWNEIEQIFFNKPLLILQDEKHSGKENRSIAYGITDAKRYLTVIFTIREYRIRAISARSMHRKERKRYEKEIQKSA
ncbi:MAG: BrnT family toxin [Bacteroidota bacterium]|jgi:uncharacterized DUF497 family protein